MLLKDPFPLGSSSMSFNGHPPLGVNATTQPNQGGSLRGIKFQWAPTLGGECYLLTDFFGIVDPKEEFQWAPTLGGECYGMAVSPNTGSTQLGFNGHPPLGVNATGLSH